MTHQELLEEINEHIKASNAWGNAAWKRTAKALRAVVELHKPSNKHEVRSKCAGCYIPMPCPTIQAIEKELN